MQTGFNRWQKGMRHHQPFDKVLVFAVIIWLVFLLVPDTQRQITTRYQRAALQLGVLLPVASIGSAVQLGKQRVYLVGLFWLRNRRNSRQTDTGAPPKN